MRILLIDDHAMFSDGLCRVLKDMDPSLNIIERHSFTDCCQFLESDDNLDMVILDLKLPDAPGLTGIEYIRQHYPILPLVVLTGQDDAETVNKCMKLGVQGYILKSSTIEMLFHALRLILSGGEYFPKLAYHSGPSSETPETVLTQKSAVSLTNRELEVLKLMAKGHSNKELARCLGITEGTAKIHVATIIRKLDANNRTGAVSTANSLNLL